MRMICSSASSADGSVDGATDSPGAWLAGAGSPVVPPHADATIATAPTRARRRFCDMCVPFT